MFDRFKGKDRRLVVGLEFNESSAALLANAASLAERTGMGLHLVHAVEFSHLVYSSAYPAGYAAAKLALMNEEHLHEVAKEKLAEYVSSLGRDLPVAVSVLSGNAAEVLQAQASAHGASAIVCGFTGTPRKYRPLGLSTVLSLMGHSRVPVLVLPTNNPLPDFARDRELTITVADDLREASAEALTTACELAANLGHSRLVHLHVHGQTPREIEEWAGRIVESLIIHELEPEATMGKRDPVAETTQNIESQLIHRLGFMKNLLEAEPGCRYRTDIRYGVVTEQLHHAVEEQHTDILVFGKHRLLHKRPFTIGRVPFYAMLNMNRPVMVASTLH